MNRKIVAIATAMVIATSSMGFTVNASPYDEQINQKANEYKSAQEKLDAVNAEIQKLDNDISTLMVEIEETNNKITKTEGEIKTTSENVVKTENDMKDEEDLFRQRMRSMYMNGMDTYVEVILNSDGFSELVSRLENIKQIISYDKQLMTELTTKKTSLEEQKNKLESKKQELQGLKSDNDSRMAKLESEKGNYKAKSAAADKEKQKLSAELDGLKSSKASYEAEQAAAAAAAQERPSRGDDYTSGSGSSSSNGSSNGGGSNNTIAPPAASATGQAIVDYAYQFIGIPYVWGGTTPAGFDCSGFTQYVYRQFGYDITRTTYTQIGQGVPVSRGQLAPGDLVFFGGGPDHVGIYVGGNSYIHSPQSGESIKVSPLTRSDFIGGRRIIY
ncbi:NlpC/P60 family protein [Clostridium ihumii]|uniref:C40 family peptidase n=1 Tax=Clostridium ihumii TaxID=1470356 RepID=UPI003D3369B2